MLRPMTKSPLDSANTLLDTIIKIAPQATYFLVAASGGKDSNCVFQLAAERLTAAGISPASHLRCFYKYLVKDISCIERPIHLMRARWKIPPLYYVPSPILGRALMHGYMRNISANTMGAAQIKEIDSEWAAKLIMACDLSGIPEEAMWNITDVGECPTCKGTGKMDVGKFAHLVDTVVENGVTCCFSCKGRGVQTKREIAFKRADLKVDPDDIWVVNGHRQADSLDRRAWLSSLQHQRDKKTGVPLGGKIGLDMQQRRVFPAATWSTKDVLAYNRIKCVPPPAQLGKANQGGLDLSEKCMTWLWEHAKDDYYKVIDVFPLAAIVTKA